MYGDVHEQRKNTCYRNHELPGWWMGSLDIMAHQRSPKKPLKDNPRFLFSLCQRHVFHLWQAWKVERVAKFCTRFWSQNLLPKTNPPPQRTGLSRLPTTNFSGGKLAVQVPEGGVFIRNFLNPKRTARKKQRVFFWGVTLKLEIFGSASTEWAIKEKTLEGFFDETTSFCEDLFSTSRPS